MVIEEMVRLKSTMRQIYDNVSLLPGDKFPFPVPQSVAKGLIAHRYAELDDEVTKKPQAVVQETLSLKASDSESPRRKGRYSRRDLRADDDESETKEVAEDDSSSETNG